MTAHMKAGVIGHPVGHSLSPFIHNYWITAYGLTATYEALEIKPDRLDSEIENLLAEGYTGFNVTIPYKQAVVPLCDHVDDTAEKIGAVNTVVISAGRLTGMNTDSFGFSENIRRSAPGLGLQGGIALIVGAGGAARAVACALEDMGMNLRIANRTRDKAEQIVNDFPARVVDWEDRERAAEDAALLVNTTSLGMKGQPPLEFDMKYLPKGAAVCDIVYKPLMTPFLRQAQRRGNQVITGAGMLLHQARPAFRAWFGVMPEIDEELQKQILERAI